MKNLLSFFLFFLTFFSCLQSRSEKSDVFSPLKRRYPRKYSIKCQQRAEQDDYGYPG